MIAIAWAIVFAALLLHGEWERYKFPRVVLSFAFAAVVVSSVAELFR